MTESRSSKQRPRFLRTTLSQLVVAVLAVPAVYAAVGAAGAASFACGIACSVLPQLFFALRLERAANRGAAQAARLGLAAEAGKFLLSAAAFAVVFALIQPERPLLVFAGFGLMWAVQIVEGARLLKQPQ